MCFNYRIDYRCIACMSSAVPLYVDIVMYIVPQSIRYSSRIINNKIIADHESELLRILNSCLARD